MALSNTNNAKTIKCAQHQLMLCILNHLEKFDKWANIYIATLKGTREVTLHTDWVVEYLITYTIIMGYANAFWSDHYQYIEYIHTMHWNYGCQKFQTL